MVLLIGLGAAVVVAVMWAMGTFRSPAPANTRTVWKADAIDKSGGKLIVEEQDKSAVPVNLPTTSMTNVPQTANKPAAQASSGAR